MTTTQTTRMTDAEAREVFNQMIAASDNADTIANLELAREYFTNPNFRAKLADFVFEATCKN